MDPAPSGCKTISINHPEVFNPEGNSHIINYSHSQIKSNLRYFGNFKNIFFCSFCPPHNYCALRQHVYVMYPLPIYGLSSCVLIIKTHRNIIYEPKVILHKQNINVLYIPSTYHLYRHHRFSIKHHLQKNNINNKI